MSVTRNFEAVGTGSVRRRVAEYRERLRRTARRDALLAQILAEDAGALKRLAEA
jgi:hypothetical protein